MTSTYCQSQSSYSGSGKQSPSHPTSETRSTRKPVLCRLQLRRRTAGVHRPDGDLGFPRRPQWPRHPGGMKPCLFWGWTTFGLGVDRGIRGCWTSGVFGGLRRQRRSLSLHCDCTAKDKVCNIVISRHLESLRGMTPYRLFCKMTKKVVIGPLRILGRLAAVRAAGTKVLAPLGPAECGSSAIPVSPLGLVWRLGARRWTEQAVHGVSAITQSELSTSCPPHQGSDFPTPTFVFRNKRSNPS